MSGIQNLSPRLQGKAVASAGHLQDPEIQTNVFKDIKSKLNGTYGALVDLKLPLSKAL